MAASISGVIFNDLNQNGIFNPGDPGIPNAYVQLLFPDGTCEVVQSDGTGAYAFTNLTQPGTYTVYESVALPDACPSTIFTQPTGFTVSTTPRVSAQLITQAQIDANTSFTNRNFGHANAAQFPCSANAIVVDGNPSNLYTIDPLTGVKTLLGPLIPAGAYNAIGYSTLNNQMYGYNATTNKIVSIAANGTASLFATIPNLPVVSDYPVGAVDANGHLYLYDSNLPASRFYVVDVNPNSPYYLQLVDPATGFQLQTSNFGVPTTPRGISDWAFNPTNGLLYSVLNSNGQVVVYNPISGAQTLLTTSGIPAAAGGYGSQFFDSAGNLYAINNDTGAIYRIILTPTTATGTILSATTVIGGSVDGTSCSLAAINLISIVKQVDKTAANLGDTLTYTMTVTNDSNIPVTGVVLTDLIPSGTTLVPGSVTVGGSPSGDLPNTGITIGTMAAGASIDVVFQVKIGNTLPNPNPIPNTATVTYDSGVPVESNTVTTLVFGPSRGVQFI